MAITFRNIEISHTGLDGIHVVPGSADISFEGINTHHNGRHGIFVRPTKQDLVSAGLKPETPEMELIKAYQLLASLHNPTDENRGKALKGIGFSRWITDAASLSTIASLIIQIFSS